MNKNLPKVFANPINKEINNNRSIFYSSETRQMPTKKISEKNLLQKINEIFASKHHVYKSRVLIKTGNEEFETVIVGKTGNNLLTLTGEKISLNNIEDINRL